MPNSQIVWKYPLSLASPITDVEMPDDASVVQFALQDGVPTIWAVHSLDENFLRVGDLAVRRFRIVGTGWPITGTQDGTDLVHQGTVFSSGLVHHLFEEFAPVYVGEV